MSTAKVFRPTILMDGERLEPTISRQICRNLFGPIDHDQLRSELQAELKRIDAEKRKKWNFDFVNFEPLNGQFMWQRIGEPKTSGLPTFASQTDTTNQDSINVVERDHTSTSTEQSNDGCGSKAVGTTMETRQSTNTKAMCLKTPDYNTTRPTRRKSARITDYLRRKKKSTTSRKIKFVDDAVGDNRDALQKRVHARRLLHRGRVSCKQSTIDEFLSKLRPRHTATGKVVSS